MTTKTKAAPHTGMAGNALLCNRCGARHEMTLPMPVFLAAATMEAWGKEHAKCKGNQSAFRDATSVHDWRESDDTGASSIAIYLHMLGRFSDGRHPIDPSDFGRCYRLLALAPEWRARIGEMSQCGPVWAALSAVWDELTALYEEELPSGTAPRLYARMKELGT
jgi:hypothetical protein